MRLAGKSISVVFVFVTAIAAFAAEDGFTTKPESIDPTLRSTPLEADRIAPTNPAKNPPLQSEPGKTDYLLYNYVSGGHANPILYLKIPHEFVGADEPRHEWGVWMILWYPEMTGPLNPVNKGRGGCLGWCNGMISMSIENWKDRGYTVVENDARHFDREMAEAQASKEEKPLSIYTKMAVDGYDEVYEVKYPYLSAGSTELIYINRSKNAGEAFYTICKPNATSPSCQVNITLDNKYNIRMKYTFSMSMLNERAKIDKAVRDLVSGFVVTMFEAPAQQR